MNQTSKHPRSRRRPTRAERIREGLNHRPDSEAPGRGLATTGSLFLRGSDSDWRSLWLVELQIADIFFLPARRDKYVVRHSLKCIHGTFTLLGYELNLIWRRDEKRTREDLKINSILKVRWVDVVACVSPSALSGSPVFLSISVISISIYIPIYICIYIYRFVLCIFIQWDISAETHMNQARGVRGHRGWGEHGSTRLQFTTLLRRMQRQRRLHYGDASFLSSEHLEALTWLTLG